MIEISVFIDESHAMQIEMPIARALQPGLSISTQFFSKSVEVVEVGC